MTRRRLPEREALDLRPVPRWYADAKLGILVHWGLYSIPAFAERTDGRAARAPAKSRSATRPPKPSHRNAKVASTSLALTCG